MQGEPKRISEAELSRNLAEAFRAVQKGETVVVEQHGRPPAAIVDFVDLQILRAVIGYYIESIRLDPDAGLPDAKIEGRTGQVLFDVVMAHYLAQSISLGRAAEALGTAWVDLRSRLTRLGIPVWTGPEDAEGIRQDALVAESLAS